MYLFVFVLNVFKRGSSFLCYYKWRSTSKSEIFINIVFTSVIFDSSNRNPYVMSVLGAYVRIGNGMYCHQCFHLCSLQNDIPLHLLGISPDDVTTSYQASRTFQNL